MYAKYEKLRDEKGVRNADVAKATGIAPSSFSDWKRGDYELKIDKLKKIAEFFGVPVSYFIDEGE